MNSKQRKQAEKLRAVALDGLESKQQHVAREIERLEKLRDEQNWHEKSKTAAAELDKLFAELETREAALERRKDMHEDNVTSQANRLNQEQRDLNARAALVEMANKPVKESINEILMLLELDESPEEIARLIRKKHHILEPKW
ncbi:hypothetical protein hairong_073 [Pseudomonas phage hairong]|nr:hypothetical protein hairong_073 [Pseudomonas phage hairong]